MTRTVPAKRRRGSNDAATTAFPIGNSSAAGPGVTKRQMRTATKLTDHGLDSVDSVEESLICGNTSILEPQDCQNNSTRSAAFPKLTSEVELRHSLKSDRVFRQTVMSAIEDVRTAEQALTLSDHDLVACHLYPHPDMEQIANNNNTSLTFLRLPAEIRQKIFDLVFEGQWIHVDNYAGRLRLFSITEVQETMLPDHQTWIFRWPERSTWSAGSGFTNYMFGRVLKKTIARPSCLSRVCRQLHQETSLMPYERSIFSFGSHVYASKFLNSLRTCQAQLISRIGTEAGWEFYAATAKLVPKPSQSYAFTYYGPGSLVSRMEAQVREIKRTRQANNDSEVDDKVYVEYSNRVKNAGYERGTWYGCRKIRENVAVGPTTFFKCKAGEGTKTLVELNEDNEAAAKEAAERHTRP